MSFDTNLSHFIFVLQPYSSFLFFWLACSFYIYGEVESPISITRNEPLHTTWMCACSGLFHENALLLPFLHSLVLDLSSSSSISLDFSFLIFFESLLQLIFLLLLVLLVSFFPRFPFSYSIRLLAKHWLENYKITQHKIEYSGLHWCIFHSGRTPTQHYPPLHKTNVNINSTILHNHQSICYSPTMRHFALKVTGILEKNVKMYPWQHNAE